MLVPRPPAPRIRDAKDGGQTGRMLGRRPPTLASARVDRGEVPASAPRRRRGLGLLLRRQAGALKARSLNLVERAASGLLPHSRGRGYRPGPRPSTSRPGRSSRFASSSTPCGLPTKRPSSQRRPGGAARPRDLAPRRVRPAGRRRERGQRRPAATATPGWGDPHVRGARGVQRHRHVVRRGERRAHGRRGEHAFRLGRHWKPAREAQATDRINRIGQVLDVHVHHPIA